MASDKVMIAVSEELRKLLRYEAARLERAYEEGTFHSPHYNPSPANPTRPHISLAAVIQIMLHERIAHRQRRRKAKLRRRPAGPKRPSAAAVARLEDSARRE